MKIIHKYVLREHVGPLTFSLTALTSLLLLNYVAKQIGNLVGKGLPGAVIGKFVLFSMPFTLAMTFPMSVLVATLYAFSRLAAENEVTALKANGVSMKRLLIPVVLAATVMSVGMVAFNDIVLPAANHALRTLQGDIARKKPTFGLREQIINEVSPGRFFLRTTHLDASNRMREITIYDLSDQMKRRTIYADSGSLAFAPNQTDLLLTLHHGVMLEVPNAEPFKLQRLRFSTDYVRVEGVANQLDITREDTYKSDREMTVCELQNEVSRYEHQYDTAQAGLQQALGAMVSEAMTGHPGDLPTIGPPGGYDAFPGGAAPRSANFSVGRLYCDAKLSWRRRMAKAKTAMAPTPLFAAQVQGATAQKPDSTRRAAGAQDTTKPRADSGRSLAGGQDTTRPRVDSLKALAAPDSAVQRADSAVNAVVDTAAARRAADSLRNMASISVDQERAASLANQGPIVMSGLIENARARLQEHKRQINQNAVELQKKFAISVACVVFVLIGAPVALRFPRGGVGLVIGASLAIFGVYYVGLIAGEALADRDILSPFWAMWAANILLSGVAAVLLFRMGRETATARGGDLSELLDMLRGLVRLRGRGDDDDRDARRPPPAPATAHPAPTPTPPPASGIA